MCICQRIVKYFKIRLYLHRLTLLSYSLSSYEKGFPVVKAGFVSLLCLSLPVLNAA